MPLGKDGRPRFKDCILIGDEGVGIELAGGHIGFLLCQPGLDLGHLKLERRLLLGDLGIEGRLLRLGLCLLLLAVRSDQTADQLGADGNDLEGPKAHDSLLTVR